MPPMAAGLNGFTVGLTDQDRAEEQAHLFLELGAGVVFGFARDDRDRPDEDHDGPPAEQLVTMICEGAVDAVTFTTDRAVRNLMAVADRARRGRNMLAVLNDRTVVACAGEGPLGAALEEGIAHPLGSESAEPARLVNLVHGELLERRRRYVVGHSEVMLQGAVVFVDGQPVALDDQERAVLAKLAERPGVIVRRRVLMRHVWKDPNLDPGVLERTVDSLRAKLGPLAPAVESSLRRGYRLRAVEGVVTTG